MQPSENAGSLERHVNVAVPRAELETEIQARLKRIARTTKMRGFRPGKVPLSVVDRQYGPQVRQEALGEALSRRFAAEIEAQKFKVAGTPRFAPAAEADNALEYTATFEVYPEVGVKDLSAASFERPVIEVTEADVDHTLDILRKQRATYEAAARGAQTGDRITLDYQGEIDGVALPKASAQGATAVLGSGSLFADFEQALMGTQAGEEKTLTVTFPADYHDPEVAGKTADFKVSVHEIAAPLLPALDEEFARALGVSSGDLTELRQEVKANLDREVRARVRAGIKSQVMEHLLESNADFELPNALVEAEVQYLTRQAQADLQARGVQSLPFNPQIFAEQAKRRVRLGLVINELVRAHDLAPKPEQIRAAVEERAQSYESPPEVVAWYYENPERLNEFRSMAMEDNVAEWAMGQAKVTDKPVTFDELMGRSHG